MSLKLKLINESPNYGDSTSVIKVISLQKKDQVMKIKKKVQISVNGELETTFEDAEIVMIIDDAGVFIDIKIDEDMAITDDSSDNDILTSPILSPDITASYPLSGDDLDSFLAISPIRAYLNSHTDKDAVVDDTVEIIEIETNVYNILNVESVQNALLDLESKESNLLQETTIPVSCENPRFVYLTNSGDDKSADEDDGNTFKLIEQITRKIQPSQEIINET